MIHFQFKSPFFKKSTVEKSPVHYTSLDLIVRLKGSELLYMSLHLKPLQVIPLPQLWNYHQVSPSTHLVYESESPCLEKGLTFTHVLI